MSRELHELTVAEMSRRIAGGKLSPVELVNASLARIKSTDSRLNSFVLVTADRARKAAKAAEKAVRRRRLGPLHGIPIGLKDIFSTKGIRTTAHSKLLLDNVPKEDSAVAGKLSAAGTILIGKLATHEFATGGPAFDLPFPPARNPWNTDHFTGGSSSGSGAAIAAGLVPFAMGSDTSGSIRGPAAYCGVAGHKPTFGLVSRVGVIPLSYSLDHCGPMAWTVEDCALLLDAIAGHDPNDPNSARHQPSGSYARSLGKGIKGLRIGVLRQFFERDMEATREAHRAIEDALKVLKKAGAKLTEVSLPKLADWDNCCRVIVQAEAYAIHERDLKARPQDYARITRERLLSGALLSAADYIQAQRWRRRLNAAYDALFEKVDVVATGCSLAPAARIDEMLRLPSVLPRGRLVMTPFNLTGAPALVVCAGFSGNGLPLSLQIAGRPFDDATVLRVGHAYEKLTDWRRIRPAL
jgi:aspartyl-tRNA(Asn)/glutamyl-tRNA(Gln) amidotransferase subunit A